MDEKIFEIGELDCIENETDTTIPGMVTGYLRKMGHYGQAPFFREQVTNELRYDRERGMYILGIEEVGDSYAALLKIEDRVVSEMNEEHINTITFPNPNDKLGRLLEFAQMDRNKGCLMLKKVYSDTEDVWYCLSLVPKEDVWESDDEYGKRYGYKTATEGLDIDRINWDA